MNVASCITHLSSWRTEFGNYLRSANDVFDNRWCDMQLKFESDVHLCESIVWNEPESTNDFQSIMDIVVDIRNLFETYPTCFSVPLPLNSSIDLFISDLLSSSRKMAHSIVKNMPNSSFMKEFYQKLFICTASLLKFERGEEKNHERLMFLLKEKMLSDINCEITKISNFFVETQKAMGLSYFAFQSNTLLEEIQRIVILKKSYSHFISNMYTDSHPFPIEIQKQMANKTFESLAAVLPCLTIKTLNFDAKSNEMKGILKNLKFDPNYSMEILHPELQAFTDNELSVDSCYALDFPNFDSFRLNLVSFESNLKSYTNLYNELKSRSSSSHKEYDCIQIEPEANILELVQFNQVNIIPGLKLLHFDNQKSNLLKLRTYFDHYIADTIQNYNPYIIAALETPMKMRAQEIEYKLRSKLSRLFFQSQFPTVLDDQEEAIQVFESAEEFCSFPLSVGLSQDLESLFVLMSNIEELNRTKTGIVCFENDHLNGPCRCPRDQIQVTLNLAKNNFADLLSDYPSVNWGVDLNDLRSAGLSSASYGDELIWDELRDIENGFLNNELHKRQFLVRNVETFVDQFNIFGYLLDVMDIFERVNKEFNLSEYADLKLVCNGDFSLNTTLTVCDSAPNVIKHLVIQKIQKIADGVYIQPEHFESMVKSIKINENVFKRINELIKSTLSRIKDVMVDTRRRPLEDRNVTLSYFNLIIADINHEIDFQFSLLPYLKTYLSLAKTTEIVNLSVRFHALCLSKIQPYGYCKDKQPLTAKMNEIIFHLKSAYSLSEESVFTQLERTNTQERNIELFVDAAISNSFMKNEELDPANLIDIIKENLIWVDGSLADARLHFINSLFEIHFGEAKLLLIDEKPDVDGVVDQLNHYLSSACNHHDDLSWKVYPTVPSSTTDAYSVQGTLNALFHLSDQEKRNLYQLVNADSIKLDEYFRKFALVINDEVHRWKIYELTLQAYLKYAFLLSPNFNSFSAVVPKISQSQENGDFENFYWPQKFENLFRNSLLFVNSTYNLSFQTYFDQIDTDKYRTNSENDIQEFLAFVNFISLNFDQNYMLPSLFYYYDRFSFEPISLRRGYDVNQLLIPGLVDDLVIPFIGHSASDAKQSGEPTIDMSLFLSSLVDEWSFVLSTIENLKMRDDFNNKLTITEIIRSQMLKLINRSMISINAAAVKASPCVYRPDYPFLEMKMKELYFQPNIITDGDDHATSLKCHIEAEHEMIRALHSIMFMHQYKGNFLSLLLSFKHIKHIEIPSSKDTEALNLNRTAQNKPVEEASLEGLGLSLMMQYYHLLGQAQDFSSWAVEEKAEKASQEFDERLMYQSKFLSIALSLSGFGMICSLFVYKQQIKYFANPSEEADRLL